LQQFSVLDVEGDNFIHRRWRHAATASAAFTKSVPT